MKSFVYPSALTVLCVVLAIAAVFFPVSFIPFSFAATALFAVATALSVSKTQRMITQGIIAAAFIIAMITTGSLFVSCCILLLFYPIGAAVGVSFLQKKNLNSTGASALLAAAALTLVSVLIYIFEATYPDLSVENAVAPIAELFKAALTNYLTDGNEALLADQSVLNSIDLLYTTVVSYIPSVLGIWFLLMALGAHWLLFSIMNATGHDCSHVEYFSEFRVGRAGAAVYCIATLFTLLSGTSALGYSMLNFTSVMSVVFTYAGISLIAFYLELKNIGKTKRIFICVVLFCLCLIPLGFSTVVSLIGIADSWMNIRERLRNSGV